jgi:hypothetical protein
VLALARLSNPVAISLFFFGLIGTTAVGEKALGLLVPAGALIATRGVVMLLDREGVLRPLAEAEASSRWSLGFRKEHPVGAALAIVIGIGWVAFGVAVLVG